MLPISHALLLAQPQLRDPQECLLPAVYELQGPGKDGHEKLFTKPWAMTTIMFLGMSFCLPWAYWEESKHKRQAQQALSNANGSAEPLLHGDTLASIIQQIAYTISCDC